MNIIANKKGYAAITVTIFTLVISLTIISAFAFFTLQEVNSNRAYLRSVDAHYVSESGIEDATYRIITQKQIASSELLGVGDGTTTVTINTSGNKRTIRSEGVRDDFQNNMETTIDVTTNGVNFFYGVQVGDGGLEMDTSSTITGSVYSDGNIIGNNGAVITGSATVAGGISANPNVQWTGDTANQSFASTSASRDIAQSFTAGTTGSIPKVSVRIAKVGSPASNITLRIATDSSGVPNTSDLANATIASSMVGTNAGWIDVAFASAPNVSAGTKYWIILDYGSNSSTNYWVWRKDPTDGYLNNTAKYADDWSSSHPAWVNINGDLSFKVWAGGTNTKIDSVTIGDASTGTGHANVFTNATIHGSSCPNQYCLIENPPREELPISDGLMQDWKDAAAAGGTINGDYNVTTDTSLGPKKITGNLNLISNKKTLTIAGTLYVQGNITIDNQSTIVCDSGYGDNTCLIISDGWIDVKNNGVFKGSGNADSFIMILSTAPCTDANETGQCEDAPANSAIDLHNNATGAIFYASTGELNILNGVHISEATAYKIHINQNANVTYDQGLANVNFSSGPSGGYEVKQWHEVE